MPRIESNNPSSEGIRNIKDAPAPKKAQARVKNAKRAALESLKDMTNGAASQRIKELQESSSSQTPNLKKHTITK
jgi:hypothetical protein